MFLNMRIKSKDPQTRAKAIREMVAKIGASKGRPAAFDWLVEQMRSEKDQGVLDASLALVDEAVRLLAIAGDEKEGEALRVSAANAFVDKMHGRAQSALEMGEADRSRDLLGVLAKECRSLIASSTSEAVRAAARKGLEEPAPTDLKAALSGNADAYQVANLLLGERDADRIDIVATYLEQMPAPKDLSMVEGAFAYMIGHCESYPAETVRRFTAVYARWTGMSFDDARLKFLPHEGLERLKRDLYGDNVMASMRALNDLQRLWNMGRFRQEISQMEYKGLPVSTYRDPNAGGIVTAPTH